MSKCPDWYGNEPGRKILDLGCGPFKTAGAVGVDMVKHPSVDVVHDLDQFPYPFNDDSFDAIITNHCLEHLIDPTKTFEECLRIVAPGGAIYVRLPHYTNGASFGDVTHRRYFSYRAMPNLAGGMAVGAKRLQLDKRWISTRIPFLALFVNVAPRLWEDYLCYLVTGKELFYKFNVLKNKDA